MKYTKAKITLVASNGIAKIMTSKPPLPDRPPLSLVIKQNRPELKPLVEPEYDMLAHMK